MDITELAILKQRKQELEAQIQTLMQSVIPLKKELEKVTTVAYTAYCQEARELPIWELRVSTAKTIQEARNVQKITLCSQVTWQQMYDIAVRYFADNGITGWKLWENGSYRDCGQFQYGDGYNGGPVLGVFDMDTQDAPHIVYDFDYEEIAYGD